MLPKPTYEELEQRLRELESISCERSPATDELFKNQRLMEDLIENSGALIVIKDCEGKNRMVNKKWEEITGLNREFVLGKTDEMLFPKETAHQFRKNDLRVIASGETIEVEEILDTQSGPSYFISIKFPLFDDDGKITGLCGIITDITKRKRAEKALRQSEKKYQALFNNAQVAIFKTSIDGRLIEINDRYAEMAGYPNIEACMAEFVPGNAWAHPDDRNELVSILNKEGSVSDFETEIIRRDGTHIWILFSAKIYPEESAIEGSIVEITDRKHAEEERKRLQDQLTQAQKMESVGRLAGGVAHDFNNMLGVILGYTELALEKVDASSPIQHHLKEIYNAASRSADITRQLLAFARQQTVAPRVLDLNDTIESMLKMLRRLIGEDIELIWQPETNLWPIRIDPVQIDQSLANLCVNARDAITDVGKVAIKTENIDVTEADASNHAGLFPGEYVLLTLSDDGSGMSQDVLDNLFEPFFTTKDVNQGTGLGLATVYGIVKQNKGFIDVHSQIGNGTTFEIYLPRYIDTGKMQNPSIKKVPPPNAQKSETILLVEDEPAILDMTTTMLQKLGYTVVVADTPRKAIDLAIEYPGDIHLLMTDVIMPEMNGRVLAKHLSSFYPNLKCLFMSGYTSDVIAHHGVLEEGLQFIQKPFAKKDLAVKIREVMDQANRAT